MKYKKIAAILLSIGMVSTLLSGCGKAANTNTSKAVVKSPKDYKGSIELMLPAGDYVDFVKKSILPNFKKDYPNVNVTVVTDANIDTQVAAGNAPDIYAGVFGFQPVKYAKMEKLVNYDNFSDYKDLSKRIDPKYSGKVLDGTYYVPWNVTTQMMIYNKDLFKEAGLDPAKPPVTFDEYLADAKKISALPKRKDGSKVYGNVFQNETLSAGGWYWTMLAPEYYNMNGGKYQLFNKLGTSIVFDNPEAKMSDFYTFMSKAQQYAPPTMEKNFFTRNIGMWLQYGYGWKTNLIQAAGTPMVIGKDVGIAPLPVPKAGDTSYSTLDGRSLMIFKSNPAKEAIAWQLVKYMMRDDMNLAACKELGQLPTLKTLESNAFFKLPENKVFVDQLKNTLPNEQVAALDQVSTIIQQAYTDTVINKKITPDEAVKQAADKSKALLKTLK